MIEPMKKLTVVCLKSDQAASLEKLRELGVLHVVQNRKYQSEELTEIIREKERLQWVIGNLQKEQVDTEKERSFAEYENLSAKELLEKAAKGIHNISWLEEDITNHDRMYDDLTPWGEFDGSLIDQIKEKGMDVRLCCCPADQMPEVPRDICLQKVNEQQGKVYFLAFSASPITVDLPEVTNLHTETSLSELQERTANSKKAIAETRGHLQILANYIPKLQDELDTVLEKEQFLVNRDGMGEADTLSYISGFLPAKEEENVLSHAKEQGWALQMETVDPEDPDVPTLLKVPAWARISKPLFEFIGIMPGYNEYDVSVPMLLFLSLFFGMLIGDAGYGALFLGIAFIAKVKVKSPGAKLPLNLFIVLSAVTLVWGLLSGNIFGLKQTIVPGFDWLKDQDNIKWFCFLIAAIHLSLARCWKALLLIKYPLKFLSNVGWALFIWGNFFIASKLVAGGTYPDFANYLFIVGGILVVLFDVDWKDIGSIINAPFAFIGSFVDTLSYIRLFAVGLASLSIAESFNAMAGEMYASGGFGIFMAVFVIAVGHLLNIVLGFMGVLVHGVRLNTLEFSNHMDVTWGGSFFNPFRKKSK